MAADFLDLKRHEIAARMKRLEPVVAEYRRLEAAVAALDAIGKPPRRATAHRGKHGAAGAPPKRRGRPKGSGSRRAEALAIVTANPGITVAEIAARLGINQNYLYRVLPALAEDGLIVKSGLGWRAAGGGA